MDNDKAYLLNEKSAFIWNLCDGNRSIGQISNQAAAKFKQTTNEDLVWLAIDQLGKDNLIGNYDEIPNRFAGMNKREIIKRIGLGTMIALPVISAIIAPQVVNAGNGCVGCPNVSTRRNLGTCVPRGSLVPNAPCSTDCACSFACDFDLTPPRCVVI